MTVETASNPSVEQVFPDAKILLHPTIPPPLHGLNPRSILGSKWWDEQRREAYERYDFHCHACGVHRDDSAGLAGRLDAHEEYRYNWDSCNITLIRIVALCTVCHSFIHRNRMSALYDKGIIDEAECWFVRSYGERVLGVSSGFIPEQPPFHVQDWCKWHLVMNFYSQFKNQEEWQQFYKEE